LVRDLSPPSHVAEHGDQLFHSLTAQSIGGRLGVAVVGYAVGARVGGNVTIGAGVGAAVGESKVKSKPVVPTRELRTTIRRWL
jgi:hypothetical protein